MSLTKKILLLCLVLSGVVLISCKPSPQKAQQYFERVMDYEQAVLEKEAILNQLINVEMQKTIKDSVNTASPEEMDTASYDKEINVAYSDFCLQIKESQRKMKELGPFDNKTDLLDAATALLETYRSLSEKEYQEVVDIVKIPAGRFTTDNDNRFLDLTEHIDTTLQVRIDDFTRASKTFARQYKFEITLEDSTAYQQ